VLLVAVGSVALSFEELAVTTLKEFRHPVVQDYVVAAQNLQRLGLQPGDKLAVAGSAMESFYARYGRFRVVSSIPDADEFWRLSPTDAKRVEDRLASIGVKALIAYDRPASNQETGWTMVGATREGTLSALVLRPADNHSH
jgi:hypothetical protein